MNENRMPEGIAVPVAESRHGAVTITPKGPHERKRVLLADAQQALDRLGVEKEAVMGLVRGAAEQATRQKEAALLRLQQLQELAEGYLDLLAEIEEQIAGQRVVVGDTTRAAAVAEEKRRQSTRPFRQREISLERTVESLAKRLQRAGFKPVTAE